MGLSAALGIAQTALANSAAQSAVLSKNIANVSNADYSRESSTSITQYGGGVATGPTQRATGAALLASLISAQGASTSQQALSDGLDQIAATLGLDTSTSTTSTTSATDNSPATAIGTLATALQQYANAPDDDTLATAAVGAAGAAALPQLREPHGQGPQQEEQHRRDQRDHAGRGLPGIVRQLHGARGLVEQHEHHEQDQERQQDDQAQHDGLPMRAGTGAAAYWLQPACAGIARHGVLPGVRVRSIAGPRPP